MVYIYSTCRVAELDGYYITPSAKDVDELKEDASVVYTYNEELADRYTQMGVVVNTIDPNISN